MSFALYIIALVLVLAVSWRFLGSYMAAVFEGRVHWMGWIEKPTYRLLGVDADAEQTWQRYAVSLIIYSGIAVLVLYGFERLQGSLPLNPQHFGAVGPALSLNTAMSFVTNTNWQNYAGESTMSYLTQMVALIGQQFVEHGRRHGSHARPDPRLRAAELADDRQLLGRRHPRHLLHTASHRGRRRGHLRRARRRGRRSQVRRTSTTCSTT